jgi:hypothetical protein
MMTSRSYTTNNHQPSWDVLIPGSLFFSSALCYNHPQMAPSIGFAMLGLATIFITPVTKYFTRPATISLTATLTDALNTLTDEKHDEQTEKLFSAIADLISKSVHSSVLTATLKESFVASLMDDDLHEATLNTLQRSLVKASENERLRMTILDVTKRAFVGALNDDEFVRDLMASIVTAIVQASKEEELTISVLDVVTRAVSQALANEDFVQEIRGAVKDTLQDGEMYKAGARGVIAAAFGGRSVLSKEKNDSSSLTMKKPQQN